MGEFTGVGLAEHARKALAEDWGFCLGTFGQVLTLTLLNNKLIQNGVGEYNYRHKNYLRTFVGKRVTDSYGLVKSYVWRSGNGIKFGANDRPNRGANLAFSEAREKGLFDTLPEAPGLLLWKPGHVGVYIGGGEFIECAGAPVGIFRGRIRNGRIVSGSRFTNWFRDMYVTYE